MPIKTIQIKRSKNTYLSSPQNVVLEPGELFYMKPNDASSTSGKIYVGDGVSTMQHLKDVGYTDRQAIALNTSNVLDLQTKVGNWTSSASVASKVSALEAKINTDSGNISAQTTNLNNLCGLLTDSVKGLYYPTTDGNPPSTSNTSINIGNMFMSLNAGVDKDYNWDSNINLNNPGEWKSGNKDAMYLHNSKVYGFDARVGKIFDNKFNEKGIFGKDFIIYKTVGGQKKKVVEFIRGDSGNDTAYIAGGEVTYGAFSGQQKAFMQNVNIKSSTLANCTIADGVLAGTVTANGVTINSQATSRVIINNPNIVNPIFSNGAINNSAYFANQVITTDAIKDGAVTVAKLAPGAIQPNKIQGKTGTSSILYSDANGNVFWGNAPSSANSAIVDSTFTNYLAFFRSGKTLSGKVPFSTSATSRFLNENGTWMELSTPVASSTTVGGIKVSNDFVVNANNVMRINKGCVASSTIAIMGQNETSVTGFTNRYAGKISNDGKTLIFILQTD